MVIVKMNFSRNFSGAVEGSVGSVQFQIVPCSSLYLSSRSIGPFQYLVNVNYRVLTCCTCHFQSSSHFFILDSSFCKSLQCLISALIQGGKGGHLFRLICSVLLWGGRNTANKYHCCVWGVLPVYGHTGFATAHNSMCFTGLDCSGARWALRFMPFPGLSHLGSQVLCQGTDSAGHVFCALPRSKLLRRPGAWRAHCLSKQSVLNTSPVPTRLYRIEEDGQTDGRLCQLHEGVLTQMDELHLRLTRHRQNLTARHP